MTDAIGVNTKKRGRPVTTGRGVLVGVRLQPDQLAALDAWIAKQPIPHPSRPEAMRRVLAEALWSDDDNPEWTEEDFARSRPASEVHGTKVAAAMVRKK